MSVQLTRFDPHAIMMQCAASATMLATAAIARKIGPPITSAAMTAIVATTVATVAMPSRKSSHHESLTPEASMASSIPPTASSYAWSHAAKPLSNDTHSASSACSAARSSPFAPARALFALAFSASVASSSQIHVVLLSSTVSCASSRASIASWCAWWAARIFSTNGSTVVSRAVRSAPAYVTSTGPVFSYRTPTLRSSPCSSRADSRTLSRLLAVYFSLSPSFCSSSAVDDMRAPISM